MSVKSRLKEMHEENSSLRAHIALLEAAKLGENNQAKHSGKLLWADLFVYVNSDQNLVT